MKEKKFIIENISPDGSTNKPEVHKIESIDFSWNMKRREFLATTALGMTAINIASFSKLFADESKSINSLPEGIRAHAEDIKLIALSGDGGTLVSIGRNFEEMKNRIKVWKMPEGKLVNSFEKEYKGIYGSDDDGYYINDIAVNFDGTILLSANESGYIYIRRLPGLELVKKVKLNDGGEPYVSMRDDCNEACAWSDYGPCIVFSVPDGKIRTTIRKNFTSIHHAALSPDGKKIIISNNDYKKELYDIRIFDTKSGKMTGKSKGIKYVSELTMSFNDDWSKVLVNHILYEATAKKKSYFAIYDTTKAKMMDEEVPSNENTGLIWLPEERFCATLNLDIVFSDVKTGTKLLELERSAFNIIKFLYPKNSPYLIAGLNGGEIYLYKKDEILKALKHAAKTDHDNVSWENKTISYNRLIDPAASDPTVSVSSYNYKDSTGKNITTIQRCGNVQPTGSVCSCNCVSGTFTGKLSVTRGSSSGGSIRICTCVPIK